MLEQSSGRISCLVLAPPGLMRNTLQALLRNVAELEIVAMVRDSVTALVSMRQHQPDVLVADATTSEAGVLMLVRQMAAEQPALNCVVLADTVGQQHRYFEAGAHHTLLKDFSDARLRDALLDRQPSA